mmetsp:Transcript_27273/g.67268  ORF Transcript_27273/g.67268 Transcript_27273/m.67268 type:complete len:235 (+) Transcript_27273:332-1036(+)
MSCTNILRTSASEYTCFASFMNSSPPPTYSMTRMCVSSVSMNSFVLTQYLCTTACAILISSTSSFLSSSFSRVFLIIFRAMLSKVTRSFASNTVEKAPVPSTVVETLKPLLMLWCTACLRRTKHQSFLSSSLSVYHLWLSFFLLSNTSMQKSFFPWCTRSSVVPGLTVQLSIGNSRSAPPSDTMSLGHARLRDSCFWESFWISSTLPALARSGLRTIKSNPITRCSPHARPPAI